MKFRDLAWGAFLYRNRNRGTHGERIYNDLIGDNKFLGRLQDNPLLDDFERIRDFVAHFGVHWIPKAFAKEHLLPLWPTLKPHIIALAEETLETVDFSNPPIQEAIIRAFNWPFEVWGSDTVRSKVLHFFNVRLFVMWDNRISDPYHVGGEGYLEFLRQTQIQAREAIADFEKLHDSSSVEAFLSEKLGYETKRPLTKLIDQYNWITISEGWPCSPPDWLLDFYLKL
jgi:hypothetical protein